MKEFNADLHFHGKYAGGVSRFMELPVLAREAEKKGLQLIVTGDCLNDLWMKHIKENLLENDGEFFVDGYSTKFIVNTEVETNDRVHHLIYFESLSHAEEFKEKMKGLAKFDGVGNGRPRFNLDSKEFVRRAEEFGIPVGPAHMFTPYFGIFAHYDSIFQAYEKPRFGELGMSADTPLANRLSCLKDVIFLSNSDAHGPWPHRIGREFNRLKMKKGNYEELKALFERKGEREVILNVGLNPQEGRYHESGCKNCLEIYTLKDAEARKWKCHCGGIIKKGVKTRIEQLVDFDGVERPPYIYILPLAEIISLAYGLGVTSDKVQNAWHKLVENFQNEINVLIDEPVENLIKVDEKTARAIEAFRKGFVVYDPGRAGAYGKPFILKSDSEKQLKLLEIEQKNKRKQKLLTDF
jgi:uncharacterized protein (TIGR00375 family)